MRRGSTFRYALAALGILLSLSQPAFCQETMVTLTVVDSLGRPVKDVAVSWAPEESHSLTDEKGMVRIVEKKGVELRLSATERSAWTWLRLAPATLKWPLQLKLPPKLTSESEAKSPRISVIVVNSEGMPIQGANLAWDYVSLHPSKIEWKSTDAEGMAELRNGEGAHSLRVRTAECSISVSPGYVATPYRISVPTKETNVEQTRLMK